MDFRERALAPLIRDDLARKMVFVGGPRQVGKTTLATMIGEGAGNPVYLNWDHRDHRRRILDQQWSPDADLLIFDELHKYPRWKTLIKGIWDVRPRHQRILVTGSSRLDVYRRGGDSLQGRYHFYRLHPFTVRELGGAGIRVPESRPRLQIPSIGSDPARLLEFGGFPEPLLSANRRTQRRWRRQRFERVFREDIRETESIRSLSTVELLADLMPGRVGSPVSFASLSTDLEADPQTVRRWLELLCRNYYLFRVPPFSRSLARALRKESKYYLWDWSEVPEPGPRFENMVASHLLKYAHFLDDAGGWKVDLHFLRDQQKREVDFLLTWERTPWLLVECKRSAGGRHVNLRYFGDRLNVRERYLVTLESGIDHLDRASGVRAISADRFLMALA